MTPLDTLLAAPLAWVLVPISVLMVGISKSGFGGGFGFLATPVLAVFVSPALAVAITLPILFFMDMLAMWSWRNTWISVLREGLAGFRLVMLGAAFGVLIGSVTFTLWDATALLLMLGVMSVGFVAWQGVQAMRKNARAPKSGRPWYGSLSLLGFGAGTFAGFASTLAHAGGPIVSMYLLAYRDSDGSHMPRGQFVASSVVFFFFVNAIKFPPYFFLDLFSTDTWVVTFVLLPISIVGTRLGLYLHGRFPAHLFFAACYSMLLVVGAWLIFRAISLI